MTQRYLLSDVDLGEEEAQAVADVVRSKWLSVGPRTADFERQFAEFVGAEHAIATSSCTAGLHLSLLALGVGPEDEVLVPSYTFVASANAILYQRATPVFVDIQGAHDLNLNVQDLEAKITPRTKAIVAVHLAGFPVELDRVMAIAQRHNLVVVEDACHAIGAVYAGSESSPYRGQRAGTIGDVGCFSFFANKNLVTGEGGMVVTNNAEVAQRIRLARSHGMTKTSWDKAAGRAFDYDVTDVGFNYRATELTAALGQIQLRKLPSSNDRRRELVARYRQRLGGVPGITLPFADRLEDSAHHIFPLVLADADSRQPFRQALNDQGIQTSMHYPPVHLFTQYREHFPHQVGLDVTVDVAAREVTLPLHPLLQETDIDAICDVVERWVEARNLAQLNGIA